MEGWITSAALPAVPSPLPFLAFRGGLAMLAGYRVGLANVARGRTETAGKPAR